MWTSLSATEIYAPSRYRAGAVPSCPSCPLDGNGGRGNSRSRAIILPLATIQLIIDVEADPAVATCITTIDRGAIRICVQIPPQRIQRVQSPSRIRTQERRRTPVVPLIRI